MIYLYIYLVFCLLCLIATIWIDRLERPDSDLTLVDLLVYVGFSLCPFVNLITVLYSMYIHFGIADGFKKLNFTVMKGKK